jgi:hypothetical protein
MAEWISCKDRIPAEGVCVIGYDGDSGRVGEVVRVYGTVRLEFWNTDDCDITHWQPFPKPPADDSP